MTEPDSFIMAIIERLRNSPPTKLSEEDETQTPYVEVELETDQYNPNLPPALPKFLSLSAVLAARKAALDGVSIAESFQGPSPSPVEEKEEQEEQPLTLQQEKEEQEDYSWTWDLVDDRGMYNDEPDYLGPVCGAPCDGRCQDCADYGDYEGGTDI